MTSAIHLDTAFTFANGIALKNRVMLAPMTNLQSHSDGRLATAEFDWLRMRIEGGFGSIVTAASHVRADTQAYAGQLGCFSDLHVEGLKRLADAGRLNGSGLILQLFHAGLRASRELTGVQPAAPSAVELDFPGFDVPRALAVYEIEQIIDDFVSAARRAHRAGMTGVELHAANGYLFSQFMSTVTNHRTDEWGGVLRNRARFLIRTATAVRAALPHEFIVGVRVNAEDTPHQRGFDIDEMKQVVGWLDDIGVSYVHLASGDVRARSWKHPTESTSNLRALRSAMSASTALIACGGIQTRRDADAAFEAGADIVAIGKAAIANPSWPLQATSPDFVPRGFPLTAEELGRLAVSAPFIHYLRGFRLVAG